MVKDGEYYLIDFGLATILKSSDKNVGPNTARCLGFSSASRMRGEAPSFMDDWVGLLYNLIYLARGSLPWTRGDAIDI